MRGPLSGTRILDFTIQLAGPLSTMMLAEMGAEVIKIEQPNKGAPERVGSPSYHGLSAYFMGTGWNKKSLTVNLKTTEGLTIARKLAKEADVVVENFRPGVAERLGIGYDDMLKVNDRLVYCSIAGFDKDHPFGNKPAFDLIAQALTGLISLYADEKHRPTIPLSLVDLATGMLAAQSITAALLNRSRTNSGEHVNVSLFHSALFLESPIVQGLLQGIERDIGAFTRVEHVGFLGVFTDLNNRYFVIEAPTDNFFQRFASIPELKDVASRDIYLTKVDRSENWERLDREFQEVFSKKPRDYWLEKVDQAGIPCAPVLTMDEVFSDAFNSRYLTEVTDSDLGRMRTVSFPASFSGGNGVYTRPPMLGENTQEILRKLGYKDGEIDDLKARNII